MSDQPKLKLTELHPKFVTFAQWASESPFYIGVRFDCPHCRTQRLAVLFDPPIDPHRLQEKFGFAYDPKTFAPSLNMSVWQRTGETFEALTLSPSVDAGWSGHWHGFIENGEIR